MKFQALTTFLLPVSGILASPVETSISARQAETRAKFAPDGFNIAFSSPVSGGCSGASVTYTESNEVANITLPNYSVFLPSPGRPAAQCHVSVRVIFPTTSCTRLTFLGNITGHVNVPAGLEGKFEGRDYAVSPLSSSPSQISDNANFPGPQNRDYLLQDRVGPFDVNRPLETNRNVTFVLQGQLQLQPSASTLSGSLSNDRIIFDIRSQTSC